MKFNNFKMLFCLILGIVIGIGSFYIITNKGILKTAGLFYFVGSPTNNETPFGIETSSTFRPVLINAN
ncbi:MAG TPA: hypothetical protein GXZ63_03570 [Mollicutes bacterium]|nr:hypothetical protein [Mollicutes bacterium]